MNVQVIEFVACSALIVLCHGALNTFDHDLHYECPSTKQFISRIISDHSNHYEDRLFDLQCSDVTDGADELVASCAWTNWENSYDSLLAYECNGNHYINGMKSHHDNGKEDRIWGFNCCEMHEVHMYDCVLTDWSNNWDGHQDYQVPAGYALKGVTSIHDNHKEDRLYKYEVCRIAMNDGGPLVGRRRVGEASN